MSILSDLKQLKTAQRSALRPPVTPFGQRTFPQPRRFKAEEEAGLLACELKEDLEPGGSALAYLLLEDGSRQQDTTACTVAPDNADPKVVVADPPLTPDNAGGTLTIGETVYHILYVDPDNKAHLDGTPVFGTSESLDASLGKDATITVWDFKKCHRSVGADNAATSSDTTAIPDLAVSSEDARLVSSLTYPVDGDAVGSRLWIGADGYTIIGAITLDGKDYWVLDRDVTGGSAAGSAAALQPSEGGAKGFVQDAPITVEGESVYPIVTIRNVAMRLRAKITTDICGASSTTVKDPKPMDLGQSPSFGSPLSAVTVSIVTGAGEDGHHITGNPPFVPGDVGSTVLLGLDTYQINAVDENGVATLDLACTSSTQEGTLVDNTPTLVVLNPRKHAGAAKVYPGPTGACVGATSVVIDVLVCWNESSGEWEIDGIERSAQPVAICMQVDGDNQKVIIWQRQLWGEWCGDYTYQEVFGYVCPPT